MLFVAIFGRLSFPRGMEQTDRQTDVQTYKQADRQRNEETERSTLLPRNVWSVLGGHWQGDTKRYQTPSVN